MPSREERLRDFTHKDDGLTIPRRVEATLTADPERTGVRTAKAIDALLTELHSVGVITDHAIDEILLASVEGVYRSSDEEGKP